MSGKIGATARKSTKKSSRGRTNSARGLTEPRWNSNVLFTVGLVVLAAVMIGGLIAISKLGGDDPAPAGSTAANEALVRSDSHKLSTAADGKVTVVEFLDFECESCGAAYPGVEKLRAEYKDKITYVVRYFPIQSHPNAMNAARAAEAAAKQGKFEAMYVKLFDNQTTWGHKQEAQTKAFEGYAREIGLDLGKFRADVADASTEQRITKDSDDGQTVGVQGTPTFFINGERFTDDATYEGLKAAVDAALAK